MERRRRAAFVMAMVVLIGVFLPLGSYLVKRDFSVTTVLEQKVEYSQQYMDESEYGIFLKICPYRKNNAEVIDRYPFGQMNDIQQRKIWFIFWIISALLLSAYCNRIYFLHNYLVSFRLPCFSCELVTLQKKDGKK